MPNAKRLAANRQNATKSTGPKTPAGRLTSAKNAMKHGLTSRDVLGAGELPADFEAFAAALVNQLAPVGAVEAMLADRVVCCAWRCRRAVTLEAMSLSAPSPFETDNTPALLSALRRWNSMVELLGRYERTHEGAMFRALHELQRVQAARTGDGEAVPVALDVTVGGAVLEQDEPRTVDAAS